MKGKRLWTIIYGGHIIDFQDTRSIYVLTKVSFSREFFFAKFGFVFCDKRPRIASGAVRHLFFCLILLVFRSQISWRSIPHAPSKGIID